MKKTEQKTTVTGQQPELMKPKQVTAEFGICRATLARWVARGLLKAIIINARVHRFDRADVARVIRDATI